MKFGFPRLDAQVKEQLLKAILSILMAFLVTAIVLILLGYDPIRVYSVLLVGSFNGPIQFGYMLTKLVPLIFLGLCAAVAFKGGLWNIGGEGQLYMAASAAEIVGILNIFPPAHLFLTVIIGVMAGGLWGALAGVLKGYFKADEIVTTIMMNFIAITFVYYLVLGPVRDTAVYFQNIGWPIQVSARFPVLFGYGISSAILVALAVTFAMFFLMEKSTFGFGTRILESNPSAADYAGINIKRNQVLVMFLSGSMAGFAGVALVCADQFFLSPFLSPGLGYIGIAIAILAGLNILVVIPAALLFAILYSGGNLVMSQFGIPSQTVAMISAIVILAFLASGPFVARLRRSS